jgi:membrane-associated phospholipid phosphatase
MEAAVGRNARYVLVPAAVLCAGLLAAADERPAVEAPTPTTPTTVDADGRRTIRRLPANFARGFIGVFNHDNVGPAVVGGAITAGSSIYDHDVRDAIASPMNSGQTASTAGGPIFSTLFVAGMFAGGRLSHGRFRAMTYDMLDATVVNLSYTELLKFTVLRGRPDLSDNKSFPSGHTSNAFALAAVAERHYGWKIGAPAYLLAGVVGVSRLQQDRHWLSDVVGGATLGYLVGRTVVRVNNKPLTPGTQAAAWSISPRVARHSRGLELTVVY